MPLLHGVQGAADEGEQPIGRDLAAVQHGLERLVGVEPGQEAGPDEHRRVPARCGEHLREQLEVLGADDDDGGIARCEAGRQVRGDGLRELVGFGVDLDGVPGSSGAFRNSAQARSIGSTHPGSRRANRQWSPPVPLAAFRFS